MDWNEAEGPGGQETPGVKTGPESAGGLEGGPCPCSPNLDLRVFYHEKIGNNLHTLKDKCAGLTSLSHRKEYWSAIKGVYRAFVKRL